MFHDQVVKITGTTGTTLDISALGSKGAAAVQILDASGNQVTGFGGGSIVTAAYDYIAITSYNAANDPLIIQFRTGGSGGTLVATLTLTYDGSGNLSTVTKT